MEVIVPCQAVRSFPHATSFFLVYVGGRDYFVVVVVVLFLLLCCFALRLKIIVPLKIMLDIYVLLLYIDIVAVL